MATVAQELNNTLYLTPNTPSDIVRARGLARAVDLLVVNPLPAVQCAGMRVHKATCTTYRLYRIRNSEIASVMNNQLSD